MNQRRSTTASAGLSKTPPQLSCELCKERKIKCDKLDPCTNCCSSGIACVPIYRNRRPRGRHARLRNNSDATSNAIVDGGVKEHFQRLEAPVDRRRGGAETGDPTAAMGDSRALEQRGSKLEERGGRPALRVIAESSPTTRRQGCHRLQTSDFWHNLVEDTQASELRTVVETPPSAMSDQSADTLVSRTNSTDSAISMLGLCGFNSMQQRLSLEASSSGITRADAKQLCQVYLQQVDPVIKILHRQTLTRWLINGESYLDYAQGHTSTEVLGCAVCYSAASSLTEAQAQSMFRRSRQEVATECRRSCEAAMERCGLLATRDMTVVQAFVLYLVAMRAEDRGSTAWTLVALAVRLGKSLCLESDPTAEGAMRETFFEQQCRRRLWLTICLLDLQASFAQTSDPLIPHNEVVPSLSGIRHINDADMDPACTTGIDVPDREGLTDTTFALVTYHAQSSGRQLNFAGSASSNSNVTTKGSQASDGCRAQQNLRHQQSRHFEQKALQLLRFCDPEQSGQAWFTWHGTQCLIACMRLSALRPVKRPHGDAQQSPAAPITKKGSGDAELLKLAMRVLKKSTLIHSDIRGEGFRWYVNVPWLAIAIAIAECYVSEDHEAVRQAWPLIERAYDHHKASATPGDGDSIRSPLAKLKQQGREKLRPILETLQQPSGDDGNSMTGFQLTPSSTSTTASNESVVNPFLTTSVSPPGSNSLFGSASLPSAPLFPQELSPSSFLLEGQAGMTCGMPSNSNMFSSSLPSQLDANWSVWDDFLTGVSMDEYAIPIDSAFASY